MSIDKLYDFRSLAGSSGQIRVQGWLWAHYPDPSRVMRETQAHMDKCSSVTEMITEAHIKWEGCFLQGTARECVLEDFAPNIN